MRMSDAISCVIGVVLVAISQAQAGPTQSLGFGSFHADGSASYSGPTDTDGNPVTPRVTGDFTGPPTTNTWWSSLIWERHPGNSFGQPFHPHPLSMQAASEGLYLGHPTAPASWDRGYEYSFSGSNAAITIGIDGLTAPEVQVAGDSDWTVIAAWDDGTRSMRATIGRGMPIVLAECQGGDPIVYAANATVYFQSERTIVLEKDGQYWAVFAPSGFSWTQEGDLWRCAGAAHVSAGILPDGSNDTIALFESAAFAAVRDTQVSWQWQPDSRTVRATYAFTVEQLDGGNAAPLCCLYRHQWLHADAPFTGHTYTSARGLLKLASTTSFDVDFPVPAALPQLPAVDSIDSLTATNLIAEGISDGAASYTSDTYWGGKSLGRTAQLAMMADATGDTISRDQLIVDLKYGLEEWFTVDSSSGGGGTAASDLLQAENAASMQGVTVESVEGADGAAVTGFGDGDWIRLAGIEFPSELPNRVVLRRASGAAGSAMLRLRLDSPTGLRIAEAAVGSTGGWSNWDDLAMGMTISDPDLLNGTHDVYVVCEGGGGMEMFSVDRFTFEVPGSGGSSSAAFAYHDTWGTLIGYPASYGADSELNDHHFHYGYFLWAAAVVARFDPAWADSEAWGGMVDLLVSDAANWDRSDTRYCFLRNFEPYVGYSYAAGHAGFAAGNNQESSSESMNFAAGCLMWGETTGRDDIRDLGLFLLAVESASIEQYWFDVDEQVFPAEMPRDLAGIVWDAGATYATWWTANVEEIHGINMLPITGGSLYLGARVDAVERLWAYFLAENGGGPTVWQDILWSYQAFFDPQSALSSLQTWAYTPEGGDSKARAYWWMSALSGLGQVDASVSGNAPLSAVFLNDTTRTYVAHNMLQIDSEVVFTDGFRMCVASGETLVATNDDSTPTCDPDGDFDGSGDINVSDLLILLSSWGNCQDASCPTDMTGDGVIDVSDLQAFLAAW